MDEYKYNLEYVPEQKLTINSNSLFIINFIKQIEILQSNPFNPNPEIKNLSKTKHGLFGKYEVINTDSSDI